MLTPHWEIIIHHGLTVILSHTCHLSMVVKQRSRAKVLMIDAVLKDSFELLLLGYPRRWVTEMQLRTSLL